MCERKLYIYTVWAYLKFIVIIISFVLSFVAFVLNTTITGDLLMTIFVFYFVTVVIVCSLIIFKTYYITKNVADINNNWKAEYSIIKKYTSPIVTLKFSYFIKLEIPAYEIKSIIGKSYKKMDSTDFFYIYYLNGYEKLAISYVDENNLKKRVRLSKMFNMNY